MKKGGGGGGGGERAVAKGGGEEGVGEGVAVERETGRQTTASRRGRRGQHIYNTARIAAPLAAPSPYMRGVVYIFLKRDRCTLTRGVVVYIDYQVLLFCC